jgi:hypothetical protein
MASWGRGYSPTGRTAAWKEMISTLLVRKKIISGWRDKRGWFSPLYWLDWYNHIHSIRLSITTQKSPCDETFFSYSRFACCSLLAHSKSQRLALFAASR